MSWLTSFALIRKSLHWLAWLSEESLRVAKNRPRLGKVQIHRLRLVISTSALTAVEPRCQTRKYDSSASLSVFPVEVRGDSGMHAVFLERKPHTWNLFWGSVQEIRIGMTRGSDLTFLRINCSLIDAHRSHADTSALTFKPATKWASQGPQ